jgi:threonine dehydratase
VVTNPYIERILKARVYEVAVETPLEPAPRLSRRLGNQVLLKREDLQSIFSFKLRGAYNKIAHLSESVARRGVICASAGNHAQGVALAAQRRGIPATIVMPQTTPHIKVQAVMDLGGEVVLHGDDYDSAFDRAQHLVRDHNLVYVHAFDDPDVIAGQGTIAVELLRQCGGEIDAVFVPVGGGGLIAGISVYIKALYPRVRIVGVEPTDAAAMYESLQAGRRVTLERVGLFADGVAVKRVGEEPFGLARQFVDEVVLVNTDEMCAAIQDIFEETRTIVEPAGALAVAGIRKCVVRDGWREKRLVAINSGANVNFDRLRHIAERSSLGGEREALLAVEIPEQPGSFLHFCEALGSRNVTEFNYRYDSTARAEIFAGFSLSNGRVEKEAVVHQLRESGYVVHDMSDSELAKQHVRFMVGGHARELIDEVIYRFEFPERPGALLKFLQAIGTRWNITMFHYRNHGSDNGRVLAGVQVPKSERAEFMQHLNALHYPYIDETPNPAYKMFLGA